MIDEQRHVFGALAKRRHRDANHVEAVQQIDAKASRLDFATEVAIRCGDDAHVDAAREVLAHAPDFSLLDDAQQLGLRSRRQFADLVEKQRSAMRLLEDAGAIANGAGERPAHVAEQLRLDEIVG
ncbi:MAG: hypothetical protein AUI11_03695 [Acidobacteria bacterium 13_2_20CM_2_66_4]|nr:MAG: hypothetical protein AUI11_03695 [Acidobacteria bacterium 13_2_20CM_2_66_4]